jgi:hypothetical protein
VTPWDTNISDNNATSRVKKETALFSETLISYHNLEKFDLYPSTYVEGTRETIINFLQNSLISWIAYSSKKVLFLPLCNFSLSFCGTSYGSSP